MRSISIVCVLVAAFAVASGVEARMSGKFDSSFAMETASELGSHAALISRINKVGAQMRVERARSQTKGYLCKTVYHTQAHEFPFAAKFLNSQWGSWFPATQKSLSIFLQGEASAKAFVGISAGIGMGMDLTVDVSVNPRTATGQVRLFACIGASLSVGTVGASAMAGGGVLVGFGTFKDSIVAANTEIAAEVGALGQGGVGVLIDVKGGAKAFRKTWTKYQTDAIGKPAMTKEWATKCWEFFKRCAKTGLATLKATVVGVHVNGGVGVGASASVSADLDAGMIIDGIKKGWQKIWASKPGQWVAKSKAWAGLKNTLSKVGQSKFGRAWKRVKEGASRYVRGAVDRTNEFFDYVPLTEQEADDSAAPSASTPAPQGPSAQTPAPQRPSTPAPKTKKF